jgi:hypothetical protein
LITLSIKAVITMRMVNVKLIPNKLMNVKNFRLFKTAIAVLK